MGATGKTVGMGIADTAEGGTRAVAAWREWAKEAVEERNCCNERGGSKRRRRIHEWECAARQERSATRPCCVSNNVVIGW